MYQLRRANDQPWYLKAPLLASQGVVHRERVGAAMVGGAFPGHPLYVRSGVYRVNDVPPFILSAAIPGRPLNRLLASYGWLPSRALELEQLFSTLGHLTATLHLIPPVPGATRATTDPFGHLHRMLARHPPSELSSLVKRWLREHEHDDWGPQFIHGNLRFDNIIVNGARLGFIDFENSGLGSIYQDLSRPVTEIALSCASVAFPRRRARRWIAAFLQGYARLNAFDAHTLWDFVGARVARYQLENVGISMWRRRIRGVPVSPSRLNHLLVEILNGRAVSLLLD